MEKTINNIKKILHIGPKKSKDEHYFDDEKQKMQEKFLTDKVELTRFEISKKFVSNKHNLYSHIISRADFSCSFSLILLLQAWSL